MIGAGLTRLRWQREARQLRQRALRSPSTHGVTAVLTSCGRHHLLQQTLDSFIAYNTFPLVDLIIVEDGDAPAEHLRTRYDGLSLNWIATGERVGQIAAIDYAYSRVTTPYIFHLEDDWSFYQSEFIEKSMSILLREPNCLQLWIRALDDTNGHPIEPQVYRHRCLQWRRMAYDYDSWGVWHGFSFNPGLRRFTDYRKSNGYGSLATFEFRRRGTAEAKLNEFYKDAGYYAAILCDNDGQGYVKHIGWDETVPPPAEGT